MPNSQTIHWRNVLAETGTALLSNVNADAVLGLANEIGRPVRDGNSNDLMREISPTTTGVYGDSLSSRFGLASFPFHTECAYWRDPPRYLFLHCITPGGGDRPTGYCDAIQLGGPTIVRLRESQYRVSRTSGSFLVRCLETVDNRSRIRADRECMLPVVESRDPIRNILLPLVKDAAVWHYWNSDDLLILDNWRVMHGRGSCNVADHDRRIARVLVQQHDN